MDKNEILTQMQKIATSQNQEFNNSIKTGKSLYPFKFTDCISKITVEQDNNTKRLVLHLN